MRRLVLSFVILAGVALAGVWAERVVQDPGIIGGERAVYRQVQGDKVTRFTETVEVVREEGQEAYRIRYLSDRQSIETVLLKTSMVPVRVSTVETGASLTKETVTSVSLTGWRAEATIPVLAFSDLKYTLRGFPFTRAAQATVPIEFLDIPEETPGFEYSVQAKLLGVQERTVQGRKIPCYRIELVASMTGVLRVLAGLMPKTYYWFSVAAPHYLVAYEGSSSYPGSPKSTIEIVEYSGW